MNDVIGIAITIGTVIAMGALTLRRTRQQWLSRKDSRRSDLLYTLSVAVFIGGILIILVGIVFIPNDATAQRAIPALFYTTFPTAACLLVAAFIAEIVESRTAYRTARELNPTSKSRWWLPERAVVLLLGIGWAITIFATMLTSAVLSVWIEDRTAGAETGPSTDAIVLTMFALTALYALLAATFLWHRRKRIRRNLNE